MAKAEQEFTEHGFKDNVTVKQADACEVNITNISNILLYTLINTIPFIHLLK